MVKLYPRKSKHKTISEYCNTTAVQARLLFFVFFLFNFLSLRASTPITALEEYTGNYDYIMIGNTFNATGGDPGECAMNSSSSVHLSIPGGATISKVYLHWAASGNTIDHVVYLNGHYVHSDHADLSSMSATSYYLWRGVADVTHLVTSGGTYTLSGLSIDTGSPYCGGGAAMGAFSLIVIYEDPSLPVSTLKLYRGFEDTEYNSTQTITLHDAPIPATCAPDVELSYLIWEGDSYKTESLSINGHAHNGTINGSTAYNIDIDTYDVSSYVSPGETTLTIWTHTYLQYYYPPGAWWPMLAWEGAMFDLFVVKGNVCCSPVTYAGTIGTSQTFCSSGDPSLLTNIASPSGGTGGSILYQWQSRPAGGSWSNIPGATSATYDPTTITTTTQYRRRTKRSACGSWINSNIVTITVDQPLTSAGTIGSDQTFCNSGDPATLSNLAGASGGSGGSITYQWQSRPVGGSWSNIPGATSANYNPSTITSSTQYRRRAKRSTCGGYMNSNVVTVTIHDGPDTPSASTTAVTCHGASTGEIDLTVTGGTPAYSFEWSNGETTEDLSSLPAGEYNVTVTDANGCTVESDEITITEPIAPLAIETESTNVNCHGDADGTAAVTTSGGTAPYTYEWSNGETIPVISGLAPGTYSVTVTDVNGCTIESADITITEPAAPLAIETASTNVNCYAGTDGTASVTTSGGTAPYTYEWSNGETTAAISGLTPGTYSVTVTDANGCTIESAEITITEPAAEITIETASTNANCHGDADGTASVTASGGTAPYTYEWSNGETTAAISGLTPGTYSVTVTDANGCTVESDEITITEPIAPLAIETESTNVNCHGDADGTAAVTTSGGTAPYTYEWSNGETIPAISGLTPGTYSVTVTDVNGCTIESADITITEPAAPLAIETASTNVNCHAGTDGTASVTTSGGTAPYTYEWSNGETTAAISGLTPGTYSVTVTDVNGCTIESAEITITEPAAEITIETASTNVNCHGDADGTASVTASGGTAPYTYEWSNGETAAAISGLAPGTYSVTVTDVNGCTVESDEITITEPAAPLAIETASTNVNCHGDADGTAALTTSGGTAPYTYEWSNGETTAAISGLMPGTYSVTVTDVNGCTIESADITITEPAAPLAIETASTNVNCHAGIDGTAAVTTSGGTAPYTYEWSNGETTAAISELTPGTYSVTVTDANGCTIESDEITITEPAEPLTVTVETTAVNCYDGEDGTATATVAGGTAPYTYAWSTGETSASISGLAPGTYTVTVTDANGCETTITGIEITEPAAPLTVETSGTNVNCHGAEDGTATASVSGGTAPYTYAWSNGETSSTITDLAPGTYSVIVTDANGCEISSHDVIITEPAAPLTTEIEGTDVNCHDGEDGTATVSVSGGTAPYTYEWSNGATTATITDLAAGTYSVTVTDANGCTIESDEVEIDEPSTAVNIGKIFLNDVSCHGGNDGVIVVMVEGGTAPYSYEWSNGDTTSYTTDLEPGTYSVTITDANGCTLVSDDFVITEPAPLAVELTATDALCHGDETGTVTTSVSGGTSPYDYEWSNGSDDVNLTAVGAGTYSVTITDHLGCTISSDEVTVHEPEAITLSSETYIYEICDGYITVEADGGSAPYDYNWSTGVTGTSLSGLCEGTYVVTVTDANGCSEEFEIGLFTEAAPETIHIAAYPNPVTTQGTIRVEVETAGPVMIQTVCEDGRIKEILFNGNCEAGDVMFFPIDSEKYARGLYIINATSGKVSESKRLMIMH